MQSKSQAKRLKIQKTSDKEKLILQYLLDVSTDSYIEGLLKAADIADREGTNCCGGCKDTLAAIRKEINILIGATKPWRIKDH